MPQILGSGRGTIVGAHARSARPPDIGWFQQALAARGFEVPGSGTLDAATRRVVAAFQMTYRPSNCDGTPGAETAAMLQVLDNIAPQP